MIGIIPASLSIGGGSRLLSLVGPGTLLSAVTLARTAPAWALAADGATWTEAAANTPRFHGTARRLLLEGARTNLVRNPRCEGVNTASTTATAATNWNAGTGPAQSGLTRTLGFTTISGVPCLTVRWAGTAGASVSLDLIPENGATLTAGTAYALSAHVALIAGSMAGVQGGGPVFRATATGLTLSAGPALTLDGTLRRLADVRTPTGTGSGTGGMRLTFTVTSGSTVDFTVAFGLPGMEAAAFASAAPITPPAGSPAATTRDAEAATWPLPAPYPSQGTALIKVLVPQAAPAGLDQGLLQLDDGTDANRVALYNAAGGGTVQAAVVAGATTQAVLAGGSMTPGTAFRAALAWDAAGTSLCLSGGTTVTTASARPAGLTRLLIGHASASLGRALNGEIELLTLQPSRLTDSAVQALANAT